MLWLFFDVSVRGGSGLQRRFGDGGGEEVSVQLASAALHPDMSARACLWCGGEQMRRGGRPRACQLSVSLCSSLGEILRARAWFCNNNKG